MRSFSCLPDIGYWIMGEESTKEKVVIALFIYQLSVPTVSTVELINDTPLPYHKRNKWRTELQILLVFRVFLPIEQHFGQKRKLWKLVKQ